MKVLPSYALMTVGLLVAVREMRVVSGIGPRLALAAAVAAMCAVVFFFDKALSERSLPGRMRRITRSNYIAAILLLFPFASRCGQGTWINLVLDSSLYCGAVIFFAHAAASRLDLVLPGSSLPYSRIVRWAFPLLSVFYFLVVGGQLASSYGSYRVEWVDFGFEYAPVWQTCRYGLFRLINEFSRETTSLAGHWPLIYAAISPLTLVWKSPTAVMWISTFFFSAGAFAVYLLAKFHTRSASVGAWIGSLYLLYLPVHLANLCDFHSDPLAVPFIFLGFLFAARKQWVYFGLAMAAALSCKEYVGLVYTGYGLWMLGTNKKAGTIIATAGLAWFLTAMKSGAWFDHGQASAVISANYGAIGGDRGMAGIAAYGLTHPGAVFTRLFRQNNLVALMSMFLPFLFLPIIGPFIAGRSARVAPPCSAIPDSPHEAGLKQGTPSAPGGAKRAERGWHIYEPLALVLAGGIFILVKDALSESGIELLSHRETLFFPFVVYAFIIYIAGLPAEKRRFTLLAVSIAAAATFMLQGHAFPSRGFWNMRSEYAKSGHDKVCDALLRKIPADAPVMASSRLTSHLLQRKWYFLFPRFPTPVEPEYIAVDTLEQADWNWLTRTEHQEGMRRIRNSKDWELIDEKDGVFLFRRIRP